MKKICIVIALILIFCSCGTGSQIENSPKKQEQNSSKEADEIKYKIDEDVPYVNGWTLDFETYEEYEKAYLVEYIKNLEPQEFFETEKEYPSVILEIFDLMMEEQPDIVKCEELLSVTVLGGENEFYVTYKYISKEGYEEFRSVRVRKTGEGRYGILGYGGGAPISYGLEKSDLTLEDIYKQKIKKN